MKEPLTSEEREEMIDALRERFSKAEVSEFVFIKELARLGFNASQIQEAIREIKPT